MTAVFNEILRPPETTQSGLPTVAEVECLTNKAVIISYYSAITLAEMAFRLLFYSSLMLQISRPQVSSPRVNKIFSFKNNNTFILQEHH